ncbi:MAG: hypothetical protein ACYC3L_03160 [Gemmatimonadaceae bacterium]
MAEHLGYALARHCELPVPASALCRSEASSDVFFASRMSDRPLRFPADALLRLDRGGVGLLEDCVALDVWVANEDRNPGNIIGIPNGGYGNPGFSLCLIDFEKSLLLSGKSGIEVNMMSAKQFMPKEALRTFLPRPRRRTAVIDRIAGIAPDVIRGHFADLETAIGERIAWKDTATHFLVERAKGLKDLLREAYDD